jgi:hypothetical protein
MARLLHRDIGDPKTPYMAIRYGFDVPKLMAWFGGEDRLKELSDVYGVPRPFDSRGYTRVSTANLALLLELAERMHKPLDLYQFVVEQR